MKLYNRSENEGGIARFYRNIGQIKCNSGYSWFSFQEREVAFR